MSDVLSDDWPRVGDVVCDCRYKHLRVVERDGDDVLLEDGASVSATHCGLEPADHESAHPVIESVVDERRDATDLSSQP